jgi:hypothetical protein
MSGGLEQAAIVWVPAGTGLETPQHVIGLGGAGNAIEEKVSLPAVGMWVREDHQATCTAVVQ